MLRNHILRCLVSDGYFLYVESSRTIVGDTARLVSPVVNSSPFGHCLLFWYHMYGASTGNLTVSYLTNIGQEEVLWSQTGNQGNQWRSQQVNITSTGDYNYNVSGNLLSFVMVTLFLLIIT